MSITNRPWRRIALTIILAATGTQLASGATISPTKSNGDFISGTGIPSDNFTIATTANGEAVGLKGRLRDTGQPLSQTGNIYYVPTGLAADNSSPAWSVDFQVTPQDSANNPPVVPQYFFEFKADIDPTYGVASFKTWSGPISNLNPFLPSLFTNPGAGAWSNDTTPWVLSDSTHLGFGFWNLAPPIGPTNYNANTPGEYEFQLNVFSTNLVGEPQGNPLAETSILVRAVPEPASIVMLGIAGAFMSFFVVQRRQRS